MVIELPFEAPIAHVLWTQRQRMRDWTRAPEWELRAGMARIDELDRLIGRADVDTLAKRLVDYGELAIRLEREEIAFRAATGYPTPARFWTPFLPLTHLTEAGLAYLGAEAVPGLLRACLREDLARPALRRVCATIGKVGGPEWAGFGNEWEASGWDPSRIEAALAAFPSLLAAPEPRWGGLDATGWHERQVRVMRELLGSEHARWRWRAVEGLAASGDLGARPAVAALAQDPDEDVRQAASAAAKASPG